MEDEGSSVTLRDSTGQINIFLEQELDERLERAGVDILEARVSHLAYSSEIAEMISNLLVVLCGEKSVSPVVNAGTLYK